MRSRLGGLAALLLLFAGSAVAAEDDAAIGRINHGSEEIAKPLSTEPGKMPNAIDDPLRNAASAPSSVANSGAASEGPQNASIGTASTNAPPGASRQTIPSALSPANAADDHLSWMSRMLPLTDAQKQALRTGILREQKGGGVAASDPRIAQAKIGNVLPSSVAMHELPADAAQQVPEARGFTYVRAGDRVLIVHPVDWTVVGIL
jgi:hypothetical protein